MRKVTSEVGPRSSVWALIALPLLGVGLGAVNVAANFDLIPGSYWMAKVVGREWGWLLAGFAAAWAGKTWKSSLARALTLLVPAVATYVALDAAMIARTIDGTISGPGLVLVEGIFWEVAAIVAAAGLAAVRRLISVDGLVGMAATAALPTYIAYSAWTARRNAVRAGNDDPALIDVTNVLLPAALIVGAVATLARVMTQQSSQRKSPGADVSMDA
ncbi:hypothetical protein SAMN06296429_11619 [Janibacter indicus]|uniref:Uncharacterized protein n=1 Tax=Janibacter indicus TaxID=857417 RepID=A0A1W2DBU1_9MICO|nr:hypothetical protein SAMN06296429_11619 [Janibacter indicus]